MHDKAVNLQWTVFTLQIQSDLEMAVLFSSAIVGEHETLRRNICYLTQFKAVSSGGKWSSAKCSFCEEYFTVNQ